MGIRARRKIYRHGKRGQALAIPSNLATKDEHTMAADSLVLSDPKGEVPEEVLYEWLEGIEDEYHEWKKERR